MASLTVADAASRAGPMSEAKKPKRWIAKAINPEHRGVFKKKAEAAGESTHEFAEQKKGAAGITGKQAKLALALMGASHGARHNLYKKKD